MTRTLPNSAISTPDTLRQNTELAPGAEISLPVIVKNHQELTAFAGGADCAAVVKADAYGHGAAQVSKALHEAGCRIFFVAYPHEGAEVRSSVGPDAEIYVFNGVTEADLSIFEADLLSPVCNQLVEIELWLKSGIAAGYALHFDTGMNRLGLRTEQLEQVLALTSGAPPTLVMSHLACADQPQNEMNANQLSRFKTIADRFPASKKSLCSTGGIYLGEDYHFDVLRPGIGLYGGGPARPLGLKLTPALTLTAPILSVFEAGEGETIGYGGSFTVKRPMTLATVALGYADGYLRSASNFGFGMRGGVPCPVMGRVSMDLTTVDVSDLEERPQPGDRIEFIGPKAGLEIQAEAAGTIGYELTSRLGGRISKTWRTEE